MNTFDLSIRTLAQQIRTKSLSVRDVVTAHLDALSQWNPHTNACCFIDRDGAVNAAEKLSSRLQAGERLGRLAGIPFSVKEHIRVEGMPRSEGGGWGGVEREIRHDALVATAYDEGALCLAKGNQTEFGKGFITENERYGRTVHFLDKGRTPGGSGGGDAVAVATGGVAFGIGADASGSVRIPANHCGLYGLVPTRGLLSEATLSLHTHCFTQQFRLPGIFARTLDDLHIVFSALRRFDAAYPYAGSLPLGALPDVVQRRATRIGFLPQVRGIPVVDPIAQALQQVSSKVQACGMTVTDVSDTLWSQTMEPFVMLGVQAALAAEDDILAMQGSPRTPENEGSRISNLRALLQGRLPTLSAHAIVHQQNVVEELRRAIPSVWKEVDLIIAPVAAVLPPKVTDNTYQVGASTLESHEAYFYSAMTNVLGLPSLAFPTGKASDGFPVGLQVISPRYGEGMMIKFLHEIGLNDRLQMIDGNSPG